MTSLSKPLKKFSMEKFFLYTLKRELLALKIPVTFAAFYTFDSKLFLSVKVKNNSNGRDTIDFEVTTAKDSLTEEDLNAVILYVSELYNGKSPEEINADANKENT